MEGLLIVASIFGFLSATVSGLITGLEWPPPRWIKLNQDLAMILIIVIQAMVIIFLFQGNQVLVALTILLVAPINAYLVWSFGLEADDDDSDDDDPFDPDGPKWSDFDQARALWCRPESKRPVSGRH